MSDSVDTTVDTTSSRERIKRALSHGKKGRINKDLSNKIMLYVFRAAAYITTLVLVAIIAYVVLSGLPHISLDFIFGWPQGVNAEGGIWPTIVSTVYVTALAMLICTPIAVLAAVYLAEYLYKNHMRPEQVQDFYPTPGTVSTCMFYTGLDPYTLKPVFVEKTPEGKALQRALLQYYEPRNAEKVVKALKMTHREDLIPLLVPAAGRRAMQRSARRAEAADVTIHNDGTYTVRPNQKGHNGKPAHGQSRAAAPTGRAPSPGARFAPHSAPARKPKNDQQKENTTWKTGKKKK